MTKPLAAPLSQAELNKSPKFWCPVCNLIHDGNICEQPTDQLENDNVSQKLPDMQGQKRSATMAGVTQEVKPEVAAPLPESTSPTYGEAKEAVIASLVSYTAADWREFIAWDSRSIERMEDILEDMDKAVSEVSPLPEIASEHLARHKYIPHSDFPGCHFLYDGYICKQTEDSACHKSTASPIPLGELPDLDEQCKREIAEVNEDNPKYEAEYAVVSNRAMRDCRERQLRTALGNLSLAEDIVEQLTDQLKAVPIGEGEDYHFLSGKQCEENDATQGPYIQGSEYLRLRAELLQSQQREREWHSIKEQALAKMEQQRNRAELAEARLRSQERPR